VDEMRRMNTTPNKIVCIFIFFSFWFSACSPGQLSPTPTIQSIKNKSDRTREQIIAEGQIVPAQYVDLRFSLPGFVKEILVTENQQVKAEEVIAKLDGYEEMAAQISSAESQVLSAQQALDDLYEESATKREEANQHLAQTRQDLQDAVDKRTSKIYERTSNIILDGAIAQYYSSLEKYSEALEAFDKVDFLPPDNDIRNQVWIQLTDASKATYVKRAQLNELLSYPDELSVAIADSAIEVAEASFNKAEKDYNELLTGPDPDKLETAKAVLKVAELQLESAQKMLEDLQLKAPFTGEIVSNDLVVGEYYLAGKSPPVVVADFNKWNLETNDVTELNVNKIQPGDDVTVRIDSLPDLDILGKVIKISPIGVDNQGDITYKVTVALDSIDERLRWNMTGVAIFEPE
jgi:multidrug efflux pump subunit AcrA (membrane-fusion protein)